MQKVQAKDHEEFTDEDRRHPMGNHEECRLDYTDKIEERER